MAVNAGVNGSDPSERRFSATDVTLVATGMKPASSLIPEIGLGAVIAGASVLVATSVASSFLTQPTIVDVSSMSTAALAPFAAHQHHRVRKLGCHKDVQQELLANIDRMKTTNVELTANVDQFKSKVNRLAKVEASFQEMVASSQYNVDKIMTLCKETAAVQKQMEDIMKARIVSDVLSNILRVDRSEDFTLGDNEMEILIIRMGMQHGVRFDETGFRKKLTMTSDRSIKTILNIFRNLLDDNPDDDHKLFAIDLNVL